MTTHPADALSYDGVILGQFWATSHEIAHSGTT